MSTHARSEPVAAGREPTTGMTGLAKFAGVSTAHLWGGIEAWRWMFLMQALPAAIFLVALFMIPESPRYLVSKGREDQARGVLARKRFASFTSRCTMPSACASAIPAHAWTM